MRNILIAFSGKAQSGKSLSSGMLRDMVIEKQIEELIATEGISDVSKDGDNSISFIDDDNGHPIGTFVYPRAQIFSFAAALKHIAREYFFWTGDKGIYMRSIQGAFDISEEPIPDLGRQLLINIGQKLRQIRSTIWVDYVMNKIKKEAETGIDKVFLIDDLRMKNELIIVKEFQPCYSIRMKRSSQLNIDDISENDLDDAQFDYYIENDGDEADLKVNIEKVWKDICDKNMC